MQILLELLKGEWNKMINLSVPNLSMDILENLKECLESGWVSTGGRFIPEFEEKVKNI